MSVRLEIAFEREICEHLGAKAGFTRTAPPPITTASWLSTRPI